MKCPLFEPDARCTREGRCSTAKQRRTRCGDGMWNGMAVAGFVHPMLRHVRHGRVWACGCLNGRKAVGRRRGVMQVRRATGLLGRCDVRGVQNRRGVVPTCHWCKIHSKVNFDRLRSHAHHGGVRTAVGTIARSMARGARMEATGQARWRLEVRRMA